MGTSRVPLRPRVWHLLGPHADEVVKADTPAYWLRIDLVHRHRSDYYKAPERPRKKRCLRNDRL